MNDKYNLELYKLKADLSKTFSDPKRLIIISELREGEKTVSQLVETTGIAQAVISRQLGILRSRGIVKNRRAATNVFYRISDLRICEACDIVHEVLMAHLVEEKKQAEGIIGNSLTDGGIRSKGRYA
jgi:ArsR family transcriptional regulator, virulence genes transcriptional regulator